MEQFTYLDFDMLIETVEGGYAVRVLSSPAGEASGKFILPFSDLELDNIALQLGRTRRGVRRLESPEMEVARNFGRRLFEAVFHQEVRDRLRGSLGSVSREGNGLRIRLRMAGAPELSNLPWEYLYDPSSDRFLVLSVQTPLVRYLEIPQPARPLSVKPPLNVVLMISNPEDYSRLDVELEWDKLNDALGSLERQGLVSLHRLEAASLDSLLRKIRSGEYHIFHFVGHGGFDRQAEDGVLVMEDEHRRSRLISGRYLGTILHDHRSMRLAILNACEGARTSRNDPFAGVAQSLVQQGIPAVIAMQFEITDEAAITFSHELYGAMAEGYPIDAALAEARKSIFAQDNDVEWGTPVLYLCSPDGVIFNVARVEKPPSRREPEGILPDPELEQRVENLYTEALSAFWLEEWARASRLFQSILELQPNHKEVSMRLSETERQLNLQTLYERAQSAESAGDWQGALSALEQLAELAPNYKDVPKRIEKAKRQSQLAELYGEVRQLHQASKWQAVLNIFSRIDSIDPHFPDPENLRATAEVEAEAIERKAELDSLYRRAVREIDAKHWEASRQLLLQIEEIQPDYLQARRLLERVDSEISRQAAERQRQEQQARMYEEALNLAKANQWRLVHERMEEIRQLEPGFIDPEELVTRAKQAIAEEERKVEEAKQLATLYSEAVQLVEAGKFQEALARWGDVQSLDANYPDRHKVYTTATRRLNEMAKSPVREIHSQEQIARIPEDARDPAKAKSATEKDAGAGVQMFLPPQRTEWALIVTTYGSLLGGLSFALFGEPGILFYLLLSSTLFGAALWTGLRMHLPSLNLFHLVGLILGWLVGLHLGWGTSFGLFPGEHLYWHAVGGTVGGLVTGLVIKRTAPELSKSRLWVIILGWAAGLYIGEYVGRTLGDFDLTIAIMMRIGVAGLIGSWVTLEAIQERPIRRLNWMLVLVSVLGFIIGQALADSILLSEPPVIFFVLLALALWGLLGSAALGIPSRNPRNIALLGGAGAAGMLIGVLLWYFGTGFDDTIMWHLDDLHFHNDINLFLGLGLGLVLGLSTRRVSTALILPIVGAAAFVGSVAFIDDLWNFTNWGAYTDWDYTQQWLLSDILGGAFVGGVLGLAWGYLMNPKTQANTGFERHPKAQAWFDSHP